jgi:hypothetical protein
MSKLTTQPGSPKRLRQPGGKTKAIVAIASSVIIVSALVGSFWLERGYANDGPHGATLAASFQANGTGGYATPNGNVTNITIQVVNLTVPLSELVIGIEPHLDASISPTANWSLVVYSNSSASSPVANYTIDGNGPLWNTSDAGSISVGMIFAIFTPTGIYMPGGIVSFTAPDGTSVLAWIS